MATTSSRNESTGGFLGPRKTMIIMVTVVGCIAILWPKVFYPMIVGPGQTKSVIKDHRGPGCCDVVLDQETFANASINLSSQQNLFRKRNIGPAVEDCSIRQERPPHLRAETVHPAMRERGRAISHGGSVQSERPQSAPRIVEGRPGPIPGMRPPMGAGSHQSTKSANSMGFIMPLYTIGIVSFFIYTILKLIFKKTPNAPYPEIKPDPAFRNEVFNPEPQYIKRPDTGNTKLGEQTTHGENDVPATAVPVSNGSASISPIQAEISVNYVQLEAKPEHPAATDSPVATEEIIKPVSVVLLKQEFAAAGASEKTTNEQEQTNDDLVQPTYDPTTEKVVDGIVVKEVVRFEDERPNIEIVKQIASQVVEDVIQGVETNVERKTEAVAVEIVEEAIKQVDASVCMSQPSDSDGKDEMLSKTVHAESTIDKDVNVVTTEGMIESVTNHLPEQVSTVESVTPKEITDPENTLNTNTNDKKTSEIIANESDLPKPCPETVTHIDSEESVVKALAVEVEAVEQAKEIELCADLDDSVKDEIDAEEVAIKALAAEVEAAGKAEETDVKTVAEDLVAEILEQAQEIADEEVVEESAALPSPTQKPCDDQITVRFALEDENQQRIVEESAVVEMDIIKDEQVIHTEEVLTESVERQPTREKDPMIDDGDKEIETGDESPKTELVDEAVVKKVSFNDVEVIRNIKSEDTIEDQPTLDTAIDSAQVVEKQENEIGEIVSDDIEDSFVLPSYDPATQKLVDGQVINRFDSGGSSEASTSLPKTAVEHEKVHKSVSDESVKDKIEDTEECAGAIPQSQHTSDTRDLSSDSTVPKLLDKQVEPECVVPDYKETPVCEPLAESTSMDDIVTEPQQAADDEGLKVHESTGETNFPEQPTVTEYHISADDKPEEVVLSEPAISEAVAATSETVPEAILKECEPVESTPKSSSNDVCAEKQNAEPIAEEKADYTEDVCKNDEVVNEKSEHEMKGNVISESENTESEISDEEKVIKTEQTLVNDAVVPSSTEAILESNEHELGDQITEAVVAKNIVLSVEADPKSPESNTKTEVDSCASDEPVKTESSENSEGTSQESPEIVQKTEICVELKSNESEKKDDVDVDRNTSYSLEANVTDESIVESTVEEFSDETVRGSAETSQNEIESTADLVQQPEKEEVELTITEECIVEQVPIDHTTVKLESKMELEKEEQSIIVQPCTTVDSKNECIEKLVEDFSEEKLSAAAADDSKSIDELSTEPTAVLSTKEEEPIVEQSVVIEETIRAQLSSEPKEHTIDRQTCITPELDNQTTETIEEESSEEKLLSAAAESSKALDDSIVEDGVSTEPTTIESMKKEEPVEPIVVEKTVVTQSSTKSEEQTIVDDSCGYPESNNENIEELVEVSSEENLLTDASDASKHLEESSQKSFAETGPFTAEERFTEELVVEQAVLEQPTENETEIEKTISTQPPSDTKEQLIVTQPSLASEQNKLVEPNEEVSSEEELLAAAAESSKFLGESIVEDCSPVSKTPSGAPTAAAIVESPEPIQVEAASVVETVLVDEPKATAVVIEKSSCELVEVDTSTSSIAPAAEETAFETKTETNVEEVVPEKPQTSDNQKSMDEDSTVSETIITTETIIDCCSNEPVILNGDESTVEVVAISDVCDVPRVESANKVFAGRFSGHGPTIEEIDDDNVKAADDGKTSEEIVIKVQVEKADTSDMISEVIDEPIEGAASVAEAEAEPFVTEEVSVSTLETVDEQVEEDVPIQKPEKLIIENSVKSSNLVEDEQTQARAPEKKSEENLSTETLVKVDTERPIETDIIASGDQEQENKSTHQMEQSGSSECNEQAAVGQKAETDVQDSEKTESVDIVTSSAGVKESESPEVIDNLQVISEDQASATDSDLLTPSAAPAPETLSTDTKDTQPTLTQESATDGEASEQVGTGQEPLTAEKLEHVTKESLVERIMTEATAVADEIESIVEYIIAEKITQTPAPEAGSQRSPVEAQDQSTSASVSEPQTLSASAANVVECVAIEEKISATNSTTVTVPARSFHSAEANSSINQLSTSSDTNQPATLTIQSQAPPSSSPSPAIELNSSQIEQEDDTHNRVAQNSSLNFIAAEKTHAIAHTIASDSITSDCTANSPSSSTSSTISISEQRPSDSSNSSSEAAIGQVPTNVSNVTNPKFLTLNLVNYSHSDSSGNNSNSSASALNMSRNVAGSADVAAAVTPESSDQLMELDLLRRKLDETEQAMSKIIANMGAIMKGQETVETNDEAAVEKNADQNGHAVEPIDSCDSDVIPAKQQQHLRDEIIENKEQPEKPCDTDVVPKKLDTSEDRGSLKVIPMEKKAAYEAGRPISRAVTPVRSVTLDSATAESDGAETKCVLLDTNVQQTSKVVVADSDLAVETLDASQKTNEEKPFDLNLIVVFESLSSLNQGRSLELNVLLGSEPTTPVVHPSATTRVVSPTREVVLSGKMKLSLVKLDENKQEATDDAVSRVKNSTSKKEDVTDGSLGSNEE